MMCKEVKEDKRIRSLSDSGRWEVGSNEVSLLVLLRMKMIMEHIL